MEGEGRKEYGREGKGGKGEGKGEMPSLGISKKDWKQEHKRKVQRIMGTGNIGSGKKTRERRKGDCKRGKEEGNMREKK